MTTKYDEGLLQQIERYARSRLKALPCREYHLTTILELIGEIRRLRSVLKAGFDRDGTVEDVEILPCALSAEEIKQLWKAAPVSLELVLSPDDPRTESIIAFVEQCFGPHPYGQS